MNLVHSAPHIPRMWWSAIPGGIRKDGEVPGMACLTDRNPPSLGLRFACRIGPMKYQHEHFAITWGYPGELEGRNMSHFQKEDQHVVC